MRRVPLPLGSPCPAPLWNPLSRSNCPPSRLPPALTGAEGGGGVQRGQGAGREQWTAAAPTASVCEGTAIDTVGALSRRLGPSQQGRVAAGGWAGFGFLLVQQSGQGRELRGSEGGGTSLTGNLSWGEVGTRRTRAQ